MQTIRCEEVYVGNDCYDVEFSYYYEPDNFEGLDVVVNAIESVNKYDENGDPHPYEPTQQECDELFKLFPHDSVFDCDERSYEEIMQQYDEDMRHPDI